MSIMQKWDGSKDSIASLIDRLIKDVTDHPYRDELLLLTQEQLADDTIIVPSEVVEL